MKKAPKLTKKDWSDVYDALLDAAEVHHSGPKADRIVELAKKIRESGVTS